MDMLLLLLCYQDSPDTGPGLVEQSRKNDAPVGRGEERRGTKAEGKRGREKSQGKRVTSKEKRS